MGPYRAHLSAVTVHGRDAFVPEVRTVPGSCSQLNLTAVVVPLRLKSSVLDDGRPDCDSKNVHVSSVGQTMIYKCKNCGKEWMWARG